MPERKYTYKVEIDAAQAKAQAEELRRTLTAMLDDIAPQQRQVGLFIRQHHAGGRESVGTGVQHVERKQ